MYSNNFNNGYNPYMFNNMSNIDNLRGTTNFISPINNYSSYGNNIAKVGLLSRLTKTGVNWNSFLNNTSRTLNIVNQAIPIVNQAKPLVNNMRTMLKIATIMKDEPEDKKNKIIRNPKEKSSLIEDNQPTFFI